MNRLFGLLLLCLLGTLPATAQQLTFNQKAVSDPKELAQTMPGLARNAIEVYKEENRETYLNNLFRLQLVAGQYADAVTTIHTLRELLKQNDPVNGPVTFKQYEIFAQAKLNEASRQVPFADAFRQTFRDTFAKMDDVAAQRTSGSFVFDLTLAQRDVQVVLDQLKTKDRIEIQEALGLIRKYQPFYVFQHILPLTEPLLQEDDEKRFITQDNVLIKTKDGATISAIVVRPKRVTAPLPTALMFTIYADVAGKWGAPKAAAARGYVGMVAFTRGKAASPDEIVPYEHEAQDTYAVIDWISKQPWSNGKVGMYGGSYNGFTQWAATKKLHPALKTIVPYVANNPGDGLPMENNVFLFVNYAWPFYTTNNKYLDNDVYFDRKRWDALNDKWYASGKSYRQIDSVDQTPNKWFQRWLQHPGYDRFWQSLVPYKNEFARINIPVLTITGYYDDGQQSAIYYLKQHYRYNPNAEHYLVIGPYDHFGAQAERKAPVLRGYAIDPVAHINTPEITFQWLDYMLRGGRKPAILEDKINYQVMGANIWKHAPSLEKMSNETLTLYLTDTKAGDHYRLAPEKPAKPGFLAQTVDFADRKTSNNDYYPNAIVGKKPDLSNGFSFISEPFAEPVSVDGTFRGEIQATINKKDMDIGVTLYEVMPNGELFHLSYFIGRASYARDMSVRKLLTPGTMESIPFEKTRLVSRMLSKGSRLLVTLNVNKHPYAQINYGTGKDVSDEDIRDAQTPLEVKWQNGSYVKIPLWREKKGRQ